MILFHHIHLGGPSLSIEEAFNNLVLYPNPSFQAFLDFLDMEVSLIHFVHLEDNDVMIDNFAGNK